jgi:hypothetical protein
MPRTLTSLPFLSALVTVLAVIFGTEVWLHEYISADLGLHLFEATLKDAGSRLFEATLKCAPGSSDSNVLG